MAYAPFTLTDLAAACFALLNDISEHAAQVSGDYVSGSIIANIGDCLGRFKLWAGNIGALKVGSKSLDARLSQAAHTRDRLLDVLRELQDSLQDLQAIVSGTRHSKPPSSEGSPSDSESDSESDTSDAVDELNLIIQSVNDCISTLLQFSVVVQKASTAIQFARSNSLPQLDPLFDINHVRARYPGLKDQIAQRLGQALTRRRQHFTYRNTHHRKLARGLNANEIRSETETTKATELIEAKSLIALPNLNEPSEYDKLELDPTHSITTFATEFGVHPSERKIPRAPLESASGRPFQCPYCFNMIIVRNRSEWKKHIFRDLRPYVCISDAECAMTLFSTRHEWFEHQLQHLQSTTCNLCNTPVPTSATLQTHLEKTHSIALSSLRVAELFDTLPRVTSEVTDLECPFCLEYGSSAEKGTPKHSTAMLKSYRKHVGRHMEQLALFCLPRASDSDDDEDDADDAKSTLSDEEEVSLDHGVKEHQLGSNVVRPGHTRDRDLPKVAVGGAIRMAHGSDEIHRAFMSNLSASAVDQRIGPDVARDMNLTAPQDDSETELRELQRVMEAQIKPAARTCIASISNSPKNTIRMHEDSIEDSIVACENLLSRLRGLPLEPFSSAKEQLLQEVGSLLQELCITRRRFAPSLVNNDPKGLPNILPSKERHADDGYHHADQQPRIQCICGDKQDDGNLVQCEGCASWQHIACYYSPVVDLRHDFHHSCVVCTTDGDSDLDCVAAGQRLQPALRDSGRSSRFSTSVSKADVDEDTLIHFSIPYEVSRQDPSILNLLRPNLSESHRRRLIEHTRRTRQKQAATHKLDLQKPHAMVSTGREGSVLLDAQGMLQQITSLPHARSPGASEHGGVENRRAELGLGKVVDSVANDSHSDQDQIIVHDNRLRARRNSMASWQAPKSSSIGATNGCKICRSTRNRASIVRCQICDDGFHISCLVPPLPGVPVHAWHCYYCSIAQEQKGSRPLLSGRAAADSTNEVVGAKAASRRMTDSEQFLKSLRIGMDEPCHKVLQIALSKYDINDDWRLYSLYIVYGGTERCLELHEKPLILFKSLANEGRKPMFMLRRHAAVAETGSTRVMKGSDAWPPGGAT